MNSEDALARKRARQKAKYNNDDGYREKQLARTRRNHLLRRYGITAEQRAEMHSAQKNRCAICGELGHLFIDHCHEREKVRGLLCRKCNVVIGMANDNPAILAAAIAYLEKHQ